MVFVDFCDDVLELAVAEHAHVHVLHGEYLCNNKRRIFILNTIYLPPPTIYQCLFNSICYSSSDAWPIASHPITKMQQLRQSESRAQCVLHICVQSMCHASLAFMRLRVRAIYAKHYTAPTACGEHFAHANALWFAMFSTTHNPPPSKHDNS